MKSLDGSFLENGFATFQPVPLPPRMRHRPPMMERFEPYVSQGQEQGQDGGCNHYDNCPICRAEMKTMVDKRIKEHWATKWIELKQDVMEFLGLLLMGIFIITLVDLLLGSK